MTEYTKGELKEVIECCNAITILFKEDDSQVGQVMDEDGNDLNNTQIANAKELVRRWNAFEEEGDVSNLLEACKVGLSYVNAIVCKVPRPISELQEDKELIEAVIASMKG